MQAKFSKYEPNSTPRQWQAHSEPLLIQENYSSANVIFKSNIDLIENNRLLHRKVNPDKHPSLFFENPSTPAPK